VLTDSLVALENPLATNEHMIAALQVMVNVVRCIALKRALAATDPDPSLNFWRLLHGNLLDAAVLDWCKLFGSDDEERQLLHWKRFFADGDDFRTGLLAHVQLGKDEWQCYWQRMKRYRDQYVAHLDFNRRDISHYPDLGPALASVCYYYSHLNAELRTKGEARFPHNLGEYYDAFLAHSSDIAGLAITSTHKITERIR